MIDANVATDLAAAAAGTHIGTGWESGDGLTVVGLFGYYEVDLLNYADEQVRDWNLSLDVREIETRTVASLAGTAVGSPEGRFGTVASREPSAARPGSDFVPLNEMPLMLVQDARRRVGGSSGAVGRNSQVRVLVAFSNELDQFGPFEEWEPQRRSAKGLRVRLELRRVSTDFSVHVQALHGVATEAVVAPVTAEPAPVVAAELGKSTVQDLGGGEGTETVIDWRVQTRLDSGFTHSTTTNPSRLQVDVAGRYQVIATVSAENTGSGRAVLRGFLRLNGTTDIDGPSARNYSRGSSYGDISLGMVTELDLAATDFLEVVTTVGDIASPGYVLNTINAQCELIVRRLEATA